MIVDYLSTILSYGATLYAVAASVYLAVILWPVVLTPATEGSVALHAIERVLMHSATLLCAGAVVAVIVGVIHNDTVSHIASYAGAVISLAASLLCFGLVFVDRKLVKLKKEKLRQLAENEDASM